MGRLDVLVRQLQGRLGGLQFSELRGVGATCPTGLSTVPIDGSGLADVRGCSVIWVGPTTHWDFRWYPLDTSIAVQNDGASQDITFAYYVVGV